MDPDRPSSDRERPSALGQIDRRTLLKGALVAGGALLGGGVALADLVHDEPAQTAAAKRRGKAHEHHSVAQQGEPEQPGVERVQQSRAPGAYSRSPNILVVMVDQLRTPAWFSTLTLAPALTPNLARLRHGAVSFDSHYTASNDCTPARSTLLTGLYTHQTGCMITSGSTLSPGFPTWGSMLRELGYSTWWYGKWHLTHGDNKWSLPADEGALEPYGFAGGTYPSPDGGPGQGWRADPGIASQFERWVASSDAKQPWCTTVSFVNPHDIAWWYIWSDQFTHEASAKQLARSLPGNFETPEQLQQQRKPLLQLSHQETTAVSFGRVPFTGPGLEEAWTPFFDLYLKLVGQVDYRIGQVMKALYSKPEIAENTIVLFTSDHGEYGGSHGMRGKGGGIYDEALRVPLLVKDLRAKKATKAPRVSRKGLTSSVDVAPLLIDLATGSNAWRRDSHYSHLANRHDMLGMLHSPRAPGRKQALHATDEIVTEYAVRTYAANAPLHVTALITEKGKLGLYSNWKPGTSEALEEGQEGELYDSNTETGKLELENTLGEGTELEASMRAQLAQANKLELQASLPRHLKGAQRHGFRDYFDIAASAAVKATERRARLLEHLEEGRTLGGGLHTMLHRQRYGFVGKKS